MSSSNSPDATPIGGPTSNSPLNNIFGALGSVLGYIGAEASTTHTLEQLLWPQRSYSNFRLQAIVSLSLLTPMGGPMHKIGLVAMDKLFQHGLLKGTDQGHMLGTVFFPEQGWAYTMHGDGVIHKSHTEPLRNCLWARALTYIPIPNTHSPPAIRTLDQPEKGTSSPLRARVTVSHLTITPATATDKDINSKLTFVCEDVNSPNLRTYAAIFTSESTGILVALGVLLGWRSAWAILWTIPLIIRLFSAACSLKREGLVNASSSSSVDPTYDFEIHCPQSDGNFILFSGPPTLVLQFFRHYGHPKRNRCRELSQILAIVLFISLFPLELVCSIIWMPLDLQYVWLSYQIYVVLAMHIIRYSHISNQTTTEVKIAEAFGSQMCRNCTAGSERECSILFGHTREDPGTLKVNLSTTYYNRNQEGQEFLKALLDRPVQPQPEPRR
ncbi:hypothetical protein F4806DRAFT_489253 [Annulohypoxylon nitens]|nr:hypothetical protein F4806DRAFT_489253 [Annulohypoxylon nitens]